MKKFINANIYKNPNISEILVEDGKIKELGNDLDDCEEVIDLEGRLVSPPYVDSHLHLDYVYTLSEMNEEGASSGTLFEAIEMWPKFKENLTVEGVKKLALKGIKDEVSQGVQYIRSHVDVTDPNFTGLKAILELKDQLKDYVDIQIVAFPQEGMYTYKGGVDLVEEALKMGADVVGGIPHYEPAVHGSSDPKEITRDDKNMEVVLDEITSSQEETENLGISAGDFIALDPRFKIENGFVKSRHLDDKASAGILLALAKEIKEESIELNRPLYMMFTIYEEVGHGASSGHPKGIKDMVAVDMGVVYDDLKTDETKVSICAKDSSGPYNFDLTNELINLAKEKKLDYAVDVYPFYGSDASAAMASDYDYRHALLGAGIAASHGYERTHEKGLEQTFILLKEYIQK